MNKEKEKIISDICPFYREYGSCDRCNTAYDIDDPPCYFECMANAIIENNYRKQEWISVDERLPEITETVLIAYKEKWEWETEWSFDVDVGSLDITGREWNTYHDLYEGQELHITHWMPLPEPPKKGGGE